MALPIREVDVNTATFEQLLMKRIERAIDAKDVGNGPIFDEVIESLEMLLKLRPNIYNELMVFKAQLIEQTTQVMQQVEAFANNARNQIQRKVFYEGEAASVEWDARKDYFDKIIEVMGNNQLIPMQVQEPATIESVVQEPVQQQQVEEPVQQQVQQPEEPQNIVQEQPQQSKRPGRKPKLSIQKPKPNFDV